MSRWRPPAWPDLAALFAHLETRLDRIEARQADNQRNIINRMDRLMTQASDNQSHLEADVAAIGASIATAVAELKAQIAGGTPAEALDFTSLDALAASTAAEAASDAPAEPPVAEPTT